MSSEDNKQQTASVGWEWPRSLKWTVAAVVLAGIVHLIDSAALSLPHVLGRRRVKATMSHMSTIGDAFEEAKDPVTGEYPCIRQTVDIGQVRFAKFRTLSFDDAWGRHLTVASGPRRYLLMSLGSDGRADRQYESQRFDGYSGDLILSNGEWLHLPSGIVTFPALLPKPEDAMMEASKCESSPTTIESRPTANAMNSECRYYLYLPSNDSARAASLELQKLGFASTVRRSSSGPEWLCVAATRATDCTGPVERLEALAAALGGTYAR
jgi:hypothetical protein